MQATNSLDTAGQPSSGDEVRAESVPALRAPRGAPSQLLGRAESVAVAGSVEPAPAERGVDPGSKECAIIDVATAHFLEHGYRGASVNAMVRASGISKESIYRYFSSKRELCEAVIERELAAQDKLLKSRVEALQSLDLRSALVALAATLLGFTTDRFLALRRLVFEQAADVPAVGSRYHEICVNRPAAAIAAILGTRAEAIGLDAPMLSRHLLGMLTWQLMLECDCAVRTTPNREEAEVLAAATVDDFIEAFLKKT